jgi:hypothetical protein
MSTERTSPLAPRFAAMTGGRAAAMAAMMLPGAAPAVLGRAQAGGVCAVPVFAGRGALSRCLAESQRSGKQPETIAGGTEEQCSVRS